MTYITRVARCLLFASFVFAPILVAANEHAENEIVLTVASESITLGYSVADLRAMGERTFQTQTIWTEGVQVFTGVSLDTFLRELGANDGIILASAINDYTVEIPIKDAVSDGPLIAYALNGELMSIRDKGPLWIVYPYDSNSAYRAEVIYSRSIWQLDRIQIKR